MNKKMLLSRCNAGKRYIQKEWAKYGRKFITFSISVRYLILILVFLFGYLGSMEFTGFGVDSMGKLYVGRKSQIEVYHEGKQIDLLQSPAGRGWNMGISSDDHILVTSGGDIYTLQLDGTVIRKDDDVNSKMNLALYRQRLITGNDGAQYRLRHEWIWPTITKNGSVVYMAPIVDMLARMTFMLVFLLVSPGSIYEIISDRKNEERNDGR